VSSAHISTWQVMKAADAAAEAEAAAARVKELEARLTTQTDSPDAADVSPPQSSPAAADAAVRIGGGDSREAGSTEALDPAEAEAGASETEALRARVAELEASAAELRAAAAEVQELKQQLSAAEVISVLGIQPCNGFLPVQPLHLLMSAQP
jgi:BMFP domain-containing protein YqiC